MATRQAIRTPSGRIVSYSHALAANPDNQVIEVDEETMRPVVASDDSTDGSTDDPPVFPPEGSIVLPNGNIQLPDGSVITPEGEAVQSNPIIT